MKSNFTAVILAAGKGTRLNCTKENKVVKKLADKPMISYTTDLLKKINIKSIIVVIGYAQESVKQILGDKYIYALQKKPLGTGNAVLSALSSLPQTCQHVLVLNADDSAFYQPEDLDQLINTHLKNKADMSLLTVIKDNPKKLGRIIRDQNKKVSAIVEYKNATEQQRKIKEVNTATYCFTKEFLQACLPQVKPNPVSHEYYLTDLLAIAVKNNKQVIAVKLSQSSRFQGVNTKEDLQLADKKMKQKN